MSDKLLPCPFCGGEAGFGYGYTGGVCRDKEYCFITCKECLQGSSLGADIQVWEKESAIKAWNSRADGWIPVSDRLPEENTEVLCYSKNHGIIIMIEPQYKEYFKVTHWMQLPKPPKGEM